MSLTNLLYYIFTAAVA